MMFKWKEFEKTKTILSQYSNYLDQSGQHHIWVRPMDFLRWIELINEDMGFLVLVDLAGIDIRSSAADTHDFEFCYEFLNMETHQRLHLHLLLNHQEVIPSIVDFYSHADWPEREQAEALGVKFSRALEGLLLPQDQRVYPLQKNPQHHHWPMDRAPIHPDLRQNPNKSEPPYPEESWIWKSYELFSATTRGDFEWMVCFDPQHVVDSRINIGFHHQGFEKMLESVDLQQALQLVEKINLGAAPTYGIAWARVIEESLRVRVPERAQAIRIAMLELARISEHLTVLFEVTRSLKFEECRLFIDAREKIYELIERFCGRRQGLGIVRFGGIREDLPPGWVVEYQVISELIQKHLKTINQALISQRKFRSALSVGQVNAQTALQWGISGPVARACGLNFDLRKSQPFYFYPDIDFDVPVGIYGTSYDRYLVRVEEIYQSFRIVTQVLDNLPLGNIVAPEMDLGYLDLQNLFLKSNILKIPHYVGLESANGEAGFLLNTLGPDRPFRAKIKTPSFYLAQALKCFVVGLRESDLVTSLAGLGIRRFELDR
jgi:NADH-quinone oxidoreductase subunit C/D